MARWGEIKSETDLGANQTVRRNAANDGWEVFTPATSTQLDGKQDALVSATNIKTINGASILGSGDLTVRGSGLTQQQVEGLI